MPVLAVVAYSVPDFAFLGHFYFAEEGEHSDVELVVCLAVVAAGVVLLDAEVVLDSKGLLVFASGSYFHDLVTVGNL